MIRLPSDIHVNAGLHSCAFGAVALWAGCWPVVAIGAATVPGAASVGTGNDLDQLASVDVADLDKVPREEEKPRRVKGDRLRDCLPLDCLVAARGLAVLFNVKAKGCRANNACSVSFLCPIFLQQLVDRLL